MKKELEEKMNQQPPSEPIRLRRGQPPSSALPQEEPAIPLTDVQAKGRASYVRTTINHIEELLSKNTPIDEIKQAYMKFHTQFPKLFEMITSPKGYKEETLQTMLSMLDRMGTGGITQHDASQIIGQRLVDTYVKPNLQKK